MNNRRLRASINEDNVGHLEEISGLWVSVPAEWLNNPTLALGPHIPLSTGALAGQCSQRRCSGYFDNLRTGRDSVFCAGAICASWMQRMRLDCWPNYGAESAGSVTLLPQDWSHKQRSHCARCRTMPLGIPHSTVAKSAAHACCHQAHVTGRRAASSPLSCERRAV